MFYIHLLTAGLGQMALHYSIGVLLIAGLLAAAWFVPVFKIDFVWAAVAVAVFLGGETFGIKDEHARCVAKAAVVQQKVDNVIRSVHSNPAKVLKDIFDSPDN